MSTPALELKQSVSNPVIEALSVDEVVDWVESQQNGLLKKYSIYFFQQDIDGDKLLQLSDDVMQKKLHMNVPSHRVTLTACIGRLKRQGTKRFRCLQQCQGEKSEISEEMEIVGKTAFTPMMSPNCSAEIRYGSPQRFCLNESKSCSDTSFTFVNAPGNSDNLHQYTSSPPPPLLPLPGFVNEWKAQHSAASVVKSGKKKKSHKSLARVLWPKNRSQLVKSGYIKKRGGSNKKLKRRWCELYMNGNMFYFDEKQPNRVALLHDVDHRTKKLYSSSYSAKVQSKEQFPNGVINVKHELQDILFIHEDNLNGFSLQTHGRLWKFLCPNHGSCIQWMSCIKKMMYS